MLAEIGFNGPSELQSEYPGIGGAETGADKITRPRQFVIGMLKRDVITIRKSFEMANTGLASDGRLAKAPDETCVDRSDDRDGGAARDERR